MKKLLIAILLLSCYAGYSQLGVPTQVPRSSAVVTVADARLKALLNLYIPTGATPTLNSGLNLPGALFFNTTDKLLYQYDGTIWKVVGGLEGIFNQKLVDQPASFRINGSANIGGGLNSYRSQFFDYDTSNVRLGGGAMSSPNFLGYTNGGGNGGQSVYGAVENTAIGQEALKELTRGSNNTALGAISLWLLKNQVGNTAVGRAALLSAGASNGGFPADSSQGNQNTGIGYNAGMQNSRGNYNVYIGAWAGYEDFTGSRNTLIGWGAGRSAGSFGEGNVMIGYRAGMNQDFSFPHYSNRLYIHNDSSQNPLIGGTFPNVSLQLNASAIKMGPLASTTDTVANANILVTDANGNVKKMNRSLIRGSGGSGSSVGGDVPAVLNVQTLLSYPYYDVPLSPGNRPAGTEKIIMQTSGRYKANDGGGATYVWCDTCAFAKDVNGKVLYNYNGAIMAYDSALSLKPYAVSGAGRWNLQYSGTLNAKVAGMKSDPTLVYDNLPYIKNILSAAASAKEVWLPEGTYPYSDSFSIRTPINIRGVRDKSILQVADNHIGFFMSFFASESFFQDITIQCTNGNGNVASTNMWQHGVISRGITRMRGVRIQYFGGCGIELTANIFLAQSHHDWGNTSNSSFENCSFYYNGWHGVRIRGDDASNMYFQSCDFRTNGGAGYWSMGFLGNSGAVNHTASNTARAGNKSVVKIAGIYYCLMIYMESWVTHGGVTYRAIADNINKEPGVAGDWATYWVAVATIQGLDEWSAGGSYIRQKQPGVDTDWEKYWAIMPSVEFDGPDYTPAWDATALHLSGGSYVEANGNGFGVHTGDYSEGGQGPNYYAGQNMAVGGDQAAGWWAPGSNGKPGSSVHAYMGKNGGMYYFPGGTLVDATDQTTPAQTQPEYVMGFNPTLGMGVKEGNNNFSGGDGGPNWISSFWLVEKYDKPNRRFIKQYANSSSYSPYWTTTLYSNKNLLDRDTLSNGGTGYVGNERFAAKMAFPGFFNYKETTGGYAYWGATGNLTPPPAAKWKIGDIMIYQGADTNYLMIRNRVEGFAAGSPYGTEYRWDTIYTGNWAKKFNFAQSDLTFTGPRYHNANNQTMYIDNLSTLTLRTKVAGSNRITLTALRPSIGLDSVTFQISRNTLSTGGVMDLYATRNGVGTGAKIGYKIAASGFQNSMYSTGYLGTSVMIMDSSFFNVSTATSLTPGGLNTRAEIGGSFASFQVPYSYMWANSLANVKNEIRVYADSISVLLFGTTAANLFIRNLQRKYPDTSTYKQMLINPANGQVKIADWWQGGGGAPADPITFDHTNGYADLDTTWTYPSLSPLIMRGSKIGVTAGTRTTVTRTAYGDSALRYQVNVITKDLGTNTPDATKVLYGDSSWRIPVYVYTSTTQTGSTYTVAAGIRTVFVNYTGGTATITLPAASSNLDRRITIRNVHASNNVTISGVVTGDANTLLGREAVELQSDGTNWYTVSNK